MSVKSLAGFFGIVGGSGTRRNQLQRRRWRRFCARSIKRCHQVPTRHGFEQRREVSAEARVLCDGHSDTAGNPQMAC